MADEQPSWIDNYPGVKRLLDRNPELEGDEEPLDRPRLTVCDTGALRRALDAAMLQLCADAVQAFRVALTREGDPPRRWVGESPEEPA